ncbi:LysR family transcriptional regulator [Rhizobium straminoryzae]|uniref:LysR family transcriptional regulator n=1 Tax=Rhizobium straminoryzae TaxID=1387186 RepID=UPI001AEE2B29|nr:LysR family transcriptional regulator [Rhizobium straminoryzae]
MADIKTTDLNLLKAFAALIETGSVTRAADMLGLTQPAVSGMLARLRDTFDDPLFVRTQRGVIPTPRAEALAEPVRAALAAIQSVLVPHVFEPGMTNLTISLAATDYAQKAVVLPLLTSLRHDAPGIRVAVRPVDREHLARQMESGLVDMALITPDMAQDTMRSRHLFDETYVCVMRDNHPAASQPMDLDLLCALDHGIMSHDGTQFRGATDEALARMGRRRRVVASIPSFMVLIEMIRCSDLMALLPRRLVAEMTGLHITEPPLAVTGFSKLLTWHERLQHDAAHRWLRDRIAELAS